MTHVINVIQYLVDGYLVSVQINNEINDVWFFRLS